jgi:hypothetical protein
MMSERPVLISRQPKARIDVEAALKATAKRTGRRLVTVALDLLAAMLGPRRLQLAEYFVQGAWSGDRDERRAFVGSSANTRLNLSLIAAGENDKSSLMTDKYKSGQVLAANGFPVPEIKAVYGASASFGSVPTLRSAETLAAWLDEPGHLPAFAKPVDGTMALGSVPLMSAGPGQIDIGDRVVETMALAHEVAAHYPRGWLIQEQLRQPPEIEALIGPGVGTVRLVTLWDANGPELLYGVWRHPAPGTWVDAAIHGKPNVGCALDHEGRVIRAQVGDLFSGRPTTHSLVAPELALVGTRLDQWPEILSIGCAAHRLFPGHALIGWDFAMTVRGPVIGEVNHCPLHMSYQRAFGRGFLHSEHRARLDRARLLLARRQGTSGRK